MIPVEFLNYDPTVKIKEELATLKAEHARKLETLKSTEIQNAHLIQEREAAYALVQSLNSRISTLARELELARQATREVKSETYLKTESREVVLRGNSGDGATYQILASRDRETGEWSGPEIDAIRVKAWNEAIEAAAKRIQERMAKELYPVQLQRVVAEFLTLVKP